MVGKKPQMGQGLYNRTGQSEDMLSGEERQQAQLAENACCAHADMLPGSHAKSPQLDMRG